MNDFQKLTEKMNWIYDELKNLRLELELHRQDKAPYLPFHCKVCGKLPQKPALNGQCEDCRPT